MKSKSHYIPCIKIAESTDLCSRLLDELANNDFDYMDYIGVLSSMCETLHLISTKLQELENTIDTLQAGEPDK